MYVQCSWISIYFKQNKHVPNFFHFIFITNHLNKCYQTMQCMLHTYSICINKKNNYAQIMSSIYEMGFNQSNNKQTLYTLLKCVLKEQRGQNNI